MQITGKSRVWNFVTNCRCTALREATERFSLTVNHQVLSLHVKLEFNLYPLPAIAFFPVILYKQLVLYSKFKNLVNSMHSI